MGQDETNGDGDRESAVNGEIVTIDAVGPLTRAEIDCQIATAKKYPRSIRKFQQEAKSMATLDEETAVACLYSLPRGGKPIEGPSVRLAEIIASAWGNLRVGARVIEEGEKFVTAQGFCHDLERNVAITMEVRRRITGKNGKRYNDDMIAMTGNAAAAIAFRNSVFKTIPKAHWKQVADAARQTALGNIETLEAKRHAAVEYVAKMGIPQPRMLEAIGKASVEDIGLEDLLALKALIGAVKSGERTVDEAFPAVAKEAADAVANKLKNAKPAPAKPQANGSTKPPQEQPPAPKQEPPPLAEGEILNDEPPLSPDEMDASFRDLIKVATTTEQCEAIRVTLLRPDVAEKLTENRTIPLKQLLAARQTKLKAAKPKATADAV